MYDIISFHDGNHWNVVIDTSESGDLEKGVKLRPYSETRDFSILTEADLLNVSVNVFEEGSVVQLVTVSSSHGTHVASMAAVSRSSIYVYVLYLCFLTQNARMYSAIIL